MGKMKRDAAQPPMAMVTSKSGEALFED